MFLIMVIFYFFFTGQKRSLNESSDESDEDIPLNELRKKRVSLGSPHPTVVDFVPPSSPPAAPSHPTTPACLKPPNPACQRAFSSACPHPYSSTIISACCSSCPKPSYSACFQPINSDSAWPHQPSYICHPPSSACLHQPVLSNRTSWRMLW